jgi:phospholipase/carboxylesterase
MRLVHAVHEPAGAGPHPTVIALHGWGANALDLLGLAPHLDGGAYLVLCPQGPIEVPIAPAVNGYGWFPLSMGQPPVPAAFEAGYEAIDAFLKEAVDRYPIAPGKLALMGFSQGGVMAYALALRQPRRFAAVAALSTWLVSDLVSGTGALPPLDGVPILVQHGSSDPMIPAARGREAVEHLRTQRAAVTYREYDMGHEINAASLRDLSEFLHRHLRSALIGV